MVGAAVAAAAVAGVAGSVIQGGAAKDAANAQAQANDRAIAAQQAQQAQTRADLLPYNTAGQANIPAFQDFYKTSQNQLNGAFDAAQAHIPTGMTQAELEATPGYQFNLNQGLKAVQNNAAAKGLGVSGAAMNAASNYATGLADSTYQNQFANQQTQYTDYLNQASTKNNQLNTIFGQIQAPVTTGENAAAQTGTLGQQSANAQSQLLNNTGAANAAGITGQAAGISNALTSAGNAGINAILLNSVSKTGSSGGL